MKQPVRLPRPTYANVASTLALVVAIGGTGYAATALPRNSVGSQQIKTGAVRAADIKDKAVRSADIKDGSVDAVDLAAGAKVPSGPAAGALAGSYPAPGLAASAPGVAVAGFEATGSPSGATLRVWFNRLGGAPVITRNGPGLYYVTIPGFRAHVYETFVGAANGVDIDHNVNVTSTFTGQVLVQVNDRAGTPIDDDFAVTLFAASPSGSTVPAAPTGPAPTTPESGAPSVPSR